MDFIRLAGMLAARRHDALPHLAARSEQTRLGLRARPIAQADLRLCPVLLRFSASWIRFPARVIDSKSTDMQITR